MSYVLTLGHLHVLGGDLMRLEEGYSCDEARRGCSPAYVFSVPGQVQFRSALHHLIGCRKRDCQSLRARVFSGMETKLRWLLQQECPLGCVHIQPSLYGKEKVLMQRRDFPIVARHLAFCPKESCAQLRRALLLKVRDQVKPSWQSIAAN